MRNYLLLVLLVISSWAVAHTQDSVVIEELMPKDMSSDENPKYWVKGYYDSIPRLAKLGTPSAQDFEDMIGRYQSKDFEYIESISDKLTLWNSIIQWIKDFLSDLFPDIDARPGDWFYNILGIAGAALVVFLLYKFFFSGKQFIRNPKEEQADEGDSIAYVERHLLDVDINNYINSAIAENNYALAIRYQQLLNIQLLAKRDFITWNQNKTNLELMDEIQLADLKEEFRNCSELFNYVWFGDFTLTKAKFEEITAVFKNFQRRWS